MTLGALKALHEMRIDIPGRISLIGFDDLDTGPLLRPPSSDGDRPADVRAGRARHAAAAAPAGARGGRRRRQPDRLDTKLVERASTAPPGGRPAPARTRKTRSR
ncbi:substrate-binding domain-containing protein [[Actinomadura] parvosata]|uniref:substrate-binding domain-containing protein n=1 Tax=[Actinomadura] parvosata TaxID=1955412 RepID=UPI00406C0BD9